MKINHLPAAGSAAGVIYKRMLVTPTPDIPSTPVPTRSILTGPSFNEREKVSLQTCSSVQSNWARTTLLIWKFAVEVAMEPVLAAHSQEMVQRPVAGAINIPVTVLILSGLVSTTWLPITQAGLWNGPDSIPTHGPVHGLNQSLQKNLIGIPCRLGRPKLQLEMRLGVGVSLSDPPSVMGTPCPQRAPNTNKVKIMLDSISFSILINRKLQNLQSKVSEKCQTRLIWIRCCIFLEQIQGFSHLGSFQ